MKAALPALLTLTLAAPVSALACATCACGDPTLTVMGVDKPYATRVRLALTTSYRSERTPSTTGGAYVEDEGRAQLEVSWAPHDRVVLAAALPFVTAGARTPNLAWSRGFGLGDGAVRLRVVAVRDRAGRHLAGLSTGLTLPTGPRLVRDGVPVPLDAQPGSGAWTPEGGLWYSWFGGPWSVFTSATARGSSRGFEARQPGAAVLGTVAAQWQPHSVVAARLSADARWADPDRTPDGPDASTGGWLVQLTPGLVVAPATDVLLVAGLGVPVAQRQGADTTEGLAPFLGVTVDL